MTTKRKLEQTYILGPAGKVALSKNILSYSRKKGQSKKMMNKILCDFNESIQTIPSEGLLRITKKKRS